VVFFPAISIPTRFTDNSCSLLDNFLVKNTAETKKIRSGVAVTHLSDHMLYFLSFNLTYRCSAERFCEVVKPVKDSLEKLKTGLRNINFIDLLDHSADANPQANYTVFQTKLQDLYNEFYPTVRVKINHYKHKKSKWITDEILSSIRYRDKLYKQVKKTPPHTATFLNLKNDLKVYNKILKSAIRDAKKAYFYEYFKQHHGNSQLTWSMINEILGKKGNKNKPNSCFKIGDSIVSNDKEIAHNFNQFFSNVSFSPDDGYSVPEGLSFSDFLPRDCGTIFSFTNTNVEEVEKVILGLKPKNSTGPDGISTSLLKHIIEEVKTPITTIINQCLSSGIFPHELKVAKITPIFKKNDPQLFDNYRPISLLPAISKVFEKIIHSQIYSYFVSNHLLFDSQYGFRELYSTQHAGLELASRCYSKLDEKQTPFCIFIDLSKAFDLVDHSILLRKLSCYGFDNNSIKLCKSYLTERRQYVKYGNVVSDKFTIDKGIPQGSVLGPLFFSIFINDLPNAAPLFNKIIYADDTSLFSTLESFDLQKTNDIEVISQNISYEFSKVLDWVKVNKLKINIDKTKCMCFSTRQRSIEYPEIVANNSIIERVKSFNFLGIIIDQHLTWSVHIDHISLKLSRITGVLNRLKNVLPYQILKQIFDSLFMSHVHYGILVWGYSGQSRIMKLQKKALRIVVHAHKLAHTDIIFKSLSVLKVSDLLKLHELKLYFSYVNNRLPYFLASIIKIPELTHYPTRHHFILEPYIPRLKLAENQLRHHLPISVNECPHSIIVKCHSHSFEGYTNYIKCIFLDKYQLQCDIRDCYACRVISGQTN